MGLSSFDDYFFFILHFLLKSITAKDWEYKYISSCNEFLSSSVLDLCKDLNESGCDLDYSVILNNFFNDFQSFVKSKKITLEFVISCISYDAVIESKEYLDYRKLKRNYLFFKIFYVRISFIIWGLNQIMTKNNQYYLQKIDSIHSKLNSLSKGLISKDKLSRKRRSTFF